jgi:FtsP/CotA-like multicopper oxidase with cupredoxin domain
MRDLKGLDGMSHKNRHLVAGGVLLLVSLLTTGLLGACMETGSSAPSQATPPVPGQVRNFTLSVRDNTLKMPDGKQIYVFGYTHDPNGKAKVPGPTLIVNEGDTVNLRLVDDKDPTRTHYNPTGDGHTIHLHGLDMPSTMDGDPMIAPDGHSVLQGQSFLYHFVANYPGTYWYHCHESAAEHIQMGMYGALIIRPRGQPREAYPGTPTFDKEYTFVLSDMDSGKHQQDYTNLYKGGENANWTQYQGNYFLINGKAWPDTMMEPQVVIDLKVRFFPRDAQRDYRLARISLISGVVHIADLVAMMGRCCFPRDEMNATKRDLEVLR